MARTSPSVSESSDSKRGGGAAKQVDSKDIGATLMSVCKKQRCAGGFDNPHQMGDSLEPVNNVCFCLHLLCAKGSLFLTE